MFSVEADSLIYQDFFTRCVVGIEAIVGHSNHICTKMYWNLIWKSPEFVSYGPNVIHFGPKSDIRVIGQRKLTPVFLRFLDFLVRTSRCVPNWSRLAKIVKNKFVGFSNICWSVQLDSLFRGSKLEKVQILKVLHLSHLRTKKVQFW